MVRNELKIKKILFPLMLAALVASLIFAVYFGYLPQSAGVVSASRSEPARGAYGNLVVFVNMRDASNPFTKETGERNAKDVLELFNDSVDKSSVHSYFLTTSFGLFRLFSSTDVILIDVEYDTESFCFSADEYDSKKAAVIEQYFIRSLLMSVAQIESVSFGAQAVTTPTGEQRSTFSGKYDRKGDGTVDSITFVMSANEEMTVGENTVTSLFTSHQWNLGGIIAGQEYDGIISELESEFPNIGNVLSSKPFIDGLAVENYCVIMAPDIYVDDGDGEQTKMAGVICHELLHVFGSDKGIADLYTPSNSEIDGMPVGFWDIMGINSKALQSLNMYYRSKMGWVKEYPSKITDDSSSDEFANIAVCNETAVADTNGVKSYRIYANNSPASNSQNKTFAVKLDCGDNSGMYFMLEYRNYHADSPIDGFIASEYSRYGGLVVYRVNTTVNGNNNSNGKCEIEFMKPSADYTCLFHGGETHRYGDEHFDTCPFFETSFNDRFGSILRDETRDILYFTDQNGNDVNSRIVIYDAKRGSDAYGDYYDVTVRLRPERYDVTFKFSSKVKKALNDGANVLVNGEFIGAVGRERMPRAKEDIKERTDAEKSRFSVKISAVGDLFVKGISDEDVLSVYRRGCSFPDIEFDRESFFATGVYEGTLNLSTVYDYSDLKSTNVLLEFENERGERLGEDVDMREFGNYLNSDVNYRMKTFISDENELLIKQLYEGEKLTVFHKNGLYVLFNEGVITVPKASDSSDTVIVKVKYYQPREVNAYVRDADGQLIRDNIVDLCINDKVFYSVSNGVINGLLVPYGAEITFRSPSYNYSTVLHAYEDINGVDIIATAKYGIVRIPVQVVAVIVILSVVIAYYFIFVRVRKERKNDNNDGGSVKDGSYDGGKQAVKSITVGEGSNTNDAE